MHTPKATGRAQHDRSAPQIEMRLPRALRPNPRNARTRTKREIRRIADSIQSAGNLQPIVVDENDVILAGHGRLAAAKLLGLEMVPTIKAVGLSEAHKRLFAIADNKLTENAGWDRDVLVREFAELAELLEHEGAKPLPDKRSPPTVERTQKPTNGLRTRFSGLRRTG